MPEPVDSINALKEDLFAADGEDPFRDPVEARRKAMDYLARREYGRLELQSKLESAGFMGETARVAVDRLAREGLQCDRRFVENLIQSRIQQGKGPVRIRLDLEARKVDTGMLEAQLSGCGEDWSALARQVRQRKFGLELPVEFKERARQMRFLQYRGFEADQVQAALAPHGDD